MRKAINHIKDKRPYSDSLGIYLRNTRRGEYLSLVSSAFESLKSVGFDLIESNELRTHIIDLFNYRYVQSLTTISSIAEMQYQSTHDIFLKRLSYDDSEEEIVIPNNYESLLDDKEFYNLLTYRIAGKNGVINHAFRLLEDTKALQKLLKEELKIHTDD